VNIARVFGPALAGLLVVTLGYGWCFTIDAGSYLAVLLCLFIMRPAELYRRPSRSRTKGEVREGLQYVRSMPLLWISFVMLGAIYMLSYNFTVTLPLFVTDTLHSSGGVFTVLYSVFGVGAVVSGRWSPTGVWCACAISSSAPLLLASPCSSWPSSRVGAAVPAVFLVGMASILYLTATTAIVQSKPSPRCTAGSSRCRRWCWGCGAHRGPVLADRRLWADGRRSYSAGSCASGSDLRLLANRRYVARTG